MGGIGSGRNKRFAPKVHEFFRLDMSSFRHGRADGCDAGIIEWTKNGESLLSAAFAFRGALLKIDLASHAGGRVRLRSEELPVSSTEQPFGGCRRWFVCLSCRNRCRVLLGRSVFRCRDCQGATYSSQYDRVHIPELVLAERTRERLGGPTGFMSAFPDRPPRMRWSTYNEMKARDFRVSQRLERALVAS